MTDERLGRRMGDFEKRVDVARRADDLDRVSAIDLGHGVDGFIEVPGTHGVASIFPVTGDFQLGTTMR
jgi:hypothetical protein